MAKYVKTEDGYQEIEELNSNKMDKNNPVGTGSFSMGRKVGSVIGKSSHAEGFSTTASGDYSYAEGYNTTASGYYSHAEGYYATASGDYSHAEGNGTTASGYSSHAEGEDTTASSSSSHAEGEDTTASGRYSSGKWQHVQGEYNIKDTNNKYSHIVGNGANSSSLSNAHTLDWSGNAWFAGEVKVGGTGQDDIAAKTLAKTEDIPTVDSTLTQSGQAADAAVVGNRLSALSEEIVTTAESKVSSHNTGTDTHSDIRLLIQDLTGRLNALADSDDTTLDQLSEIVEYIKSNRTLIEAITTNKVSVSDIIDNLTTNVPSKPLSAAQGVALKALIDAITIPTALPNPNALTFTGAVDGSYDGSEPLNVEIPSGGADCTISVDMLASGTVAQGSEEPVDTGITLGKLKEYKMFILSVCGIRNVSLHNWYTRIGGLSISRVNNVRGQTILYEFLNTEKTVMIARNGAAGNHAVYTEYKGSGKSYGVINTSCFPDCVYELSSIDESTHVITYPVKSDAVDVQWSILGVVK